MSSYVSNHVHVVFSTKNRVAIIPQEMQSRLWAYLARVSEKYGMKAVAVGGMADHAHALLDLGALIGIAKAVQVLKANSSRWMNQRATARFEWQEGYFACSVSRSQVAAVRKYIEAQREHHRSMDSSQEFAALLKRHGLDMLRH